jgi:ABC-type amino acid transport substrate-binding protein
MDAFAKKQGHTIIYKALPIPRLFDAYFAGDVDFKYPDNALWGKNDRVSKNIQYTQPVVKYIEGMMVLPKNQGKPLTQIHSMGVVRGFTPYPYFNLIKDGVLTSKEVNTLDAALRMVVNERTDGVYTNVSVGLYSLEHALRTPNALQYDPTLPNTVDYYYLSSFKCPELITEFNQFMQDEKAMIAQLKEKYQVEKGVN